MSAYVIGKLLKGLFAGASTALGSLASILVGHETLHMVTDGQWVTIASLSLGAFGGAFGLAAWSGPRNGNGAVK